MEALATGSGAQELVRQLEHWRQAAARLGDLDAVAPEAAWRTLEAYLGVTLRNAIQASIERLRRRADDAQRRLGTRGTDPQRGREAILELRTAYLRAETLVDFYADALVTRSAPGLGALLRACDHLAWRSMNDVLAPLGRPAPPALVYIDKGLGASILKAGLRLWDGGENPVAAIKVVRHNLLRPTALIHESGHQVAHILRWNEELAAMLRSVGARRTPELGELWSSWASEVAADALAFAFTGYASLAALHDVLDGDGARAFLFLPGDPHPIAYLRVLLGVELCRASYGPGPWDALERRWLGAHPLDVAPADLAPLLEGSRPLLGEMAERLLHAPFEAFAGQPLAHLVDPARVAPAALDELGIQAAGPLARSPFWIERECLRLLALTGYQAGLSAEGLRAGTGGQLEWMRRLSALRPAA